MGPIPPMTAFKLVPAQICYAVENFSLYFDTFSERRIMLGPVIWTGGQTAKPRSLLLTV